MGHKIYQVLFLCSGNSARSIMAEAILNHLGGAQFRAFSAGTHPVGRINALTLDVLHSKGIAIENLSSKSWTTFSGKGAPQFDFVITVCGQAAAELIPAWSGVPTKLHWEFPAPGQVTGSDQQIRAAFAQVYDMIEAAVKMFAGEVAHDRPQCVAGDEVLRHQAVDHCIKVSVLATPS